MRHTILLFAGVILAIAIFSFGCGGGGDKTPITPTPPPTHENPVNRIVIISGPWAWGGVANSLKGWATVGSATQWQLRMDTEYNGQWVALDEQYTLSYTVYSGHNIAQVSFGLYDKDWRGGWLLKVKPETVGQGYVDVDISGPYAPITRFHIIISPAGTPPPSCRELHPTHENVNGFWWDCDKDGKWSNTGIPVNPPPSCRDLHPTHEAINGFWWDCINGVWANTGEPVNPPPPVTYSLHIYGTQGEFTEGGAIEIDELNGYQLSIWELHGSDGSKILLDGSTTTMESSTLTATDWVWDKARQEIMTVRWANPAHPNINDPGNIFINPGCYDVSFSILCLGQKTYARNGFVEVIDVPGIP